MDNEETESVKDRPAQVDVRYRPGTLGLTGNKAPEDSDNDNEKSPYEKMLEDETEKENRRRQAMDLGFVLGTPTDESDGTILFNYDEPPKASLDEEEYRTPSYNMDSDSTLNNALRRAIREQHDQEINKRFMEGGSSGSSLGSVASTGDTDQHDTEAETAAAAGGKVHSRSLMTATGQTSSKETAAAAAAPAAPATVSATAAVSPTEQKHSEMLVSMFEPRPDDRLTLNDTFAVTVDVDVDNPLDHKEAVVVPSLQMVEDDQQLVANSPQQAQTEHETPTHSSDSPTANEEPLLLLSTPQASTGKVKKMNFFKRFFSSKKQ